MPNQLDSFVAPSLTHSIVIKPKDGGKTLTEKVNRFDEKEKTPLLSTYGHQLDTFVKKVKDRDSDIAPVDWISFEDSIAQMEVIDAIYVKAGMPLRHGSVYADIAKRGEDVQ